MNSKAKITRCIVCGDVYLKRISGKNYSNKSDIRGINTKSCSKLCSKELARRLRRKSK